MFTGGLLVPLYGATEILAGTCCHLGDPTEKMSGSDGTPALTGVTIKLAGPDGDEVAVGEEGEICYWGPGAVLGYWRNPERTAAAIDGEGWHQHRRPRAGRHRWLHPGYRQAQGHHHPRWHEHQRG